MNRILIVALFLPAVLGCKENKPRSSGRLNDSALVMQAHKLETPEDDSKTLKYGVRIYPGSKDLAALTEESKQALWYKMDSSFYLQVGRNKYYPSITEPIANGQKNNFEYLLMFDSLLETELKASTLTFKDKYISYKTHYLQLNAQ